MQIGTILWCSRKVTRCEALIALRATALVQSIPSVRIHAHFDVLQASVVVIGEAEIIRDCLEHVEPDSAFLAFEVTWL